MPTTRLWRGGGEPPARVEGRYLLLSAPSWSARCGPFDSVALAPFPLPTASGNESVHFLVQLNAGMEERPLARSASGGELSRLMLALKVVLARHDAVPTLVFDEVDQGIGGEIGGQVGAALAEVAARHQVLVIGEVLGGPGGYDGIGLTAAHAGLGITPTDYARVGGHLLTACRDLGLRSQPG